MADTDSVIAMDSITKINNFDSISINESQKVTTKEMLYISVVKFEDRNMLHELSHSPHLLLNRAKPD
ncbi:hypothetical protein L1887_38123 [Cichorium endivia]|nr:hypothetical protein L1887_38123 [Cichorium endivia]